MSAHGTTGTQDGTGGQVPRWPPFFHNKRLRDAFDDALRFDWGDPANYKFIEEIREEALRSEQELIAEGVRRAAWSCAEQSVWWGEQCAKDFDNEQARFAEGLYHDTAHVFQQLADRIESGEEPL